MRGGVRRKEGAAGLERVAVLADVAPPGRLAGRGAASTGRKARGSV